MQTSRNSQQSHRQALLLAAGAAIVGFWLLLQLAGIALGATTDWGLLAALLVASGTGYLVYMYERRRWRRAHRATPTGRRPGGRRPTGRGDGTAAMTPGATRGASAAREVSAAPRDGRLRILVVGGGGVGEELVNLITGEGHEMVVVEADPDRAERLRSHVDGLVITGNGSDPDVLAEAEIAEADVMVAVTDRDEVNVLACLLARAYGVRTVARIRNPSLFKDSEVFTQRRLGIDVVINPERTTAAELAQLMQTPAPVEEMAHFLNGRLQLVGVPVAEDSDLVGTAMRDLGLDERYLVVMIEREDQRLVVPHGETVIRPGDHVYVMGPRGILSQIGWLVGDGAQQPRAVMVLGAGLIGAQTARILEQAGLEVKLVEGDEARCRQVSGMLDRTTVVAADASDPDALLQEGLTDYDGLVAATGDDRTNLLMGYFARRAGGLRVVSELLDARYESLAEWLEIDAYVSPRVATAGRVISLLHDAENVTGIRVLQHQRAEVFEAVVAVGAPITTASLKELELSQGVLVGGILRGGEVITPRGNTQVRAGDHVVLFGLPGQVHALGDLLRND